MKTLFFSIFLITNLLSIAQQKNQVNLKVGKQLFIKPCNAIKPEFVGIGRESAIFIYIYNYNIFLFLC